MGNMDDRTKQALRRVIGYSISAEEDDFKTTHDADRRQTHIYRDLYVVAKWLGKDMSKYSKKAPREAGLSRSFGTDRDSAPR